MLPGLLDLLGWEPEELKTVPTQQAFSMDDQGQYIHLRTNQVKQLCGLITYMKHIFKPYNFGIELPDDPFLPSALDEWAKYTPTQMRTHLVQHLPNPHGPQPVPSGPKSSTRPSGYSTSAIELMGFKKGIKREIAAYSSLKDERCFDSFRGSLFIVAKSHKCNDILDPTCNPGSEPEQKKAH